MDSDYEEIFNYVKNSLSGNDIEATSIERFPFRKRSEHTWRVFTWAKRLLEQEGLPSTIDRDAVLTAAIFHDVGYALQTGEDIEHAINSAAIYNRYASSKNHPVEKSNFISWLIENHSHKQLMKLESTPIELILLMEADILDESGAMGILWDCLHTGSQENQGYLEAYHHICKYSGDILNEDPMVTKIAKEIWIEKQNLVREFIRHLEWDLGINH